jgi:hypothetical protein
MRSKNRVSLLRIHGFLAVGLVLGMAKPCAAQFQVAQQYPAVPYPQVVAVGDFNNDGKLDVVTANAGGGSLSVLLGNGDGTFQTSHEYATADDPLWVVVGDFNRDGNLDLAASNYTDLGGGTISVLLGNGDGTFQSHKDYVTGAFPVSLAVGDFNGDLIPDLVVAVPSTNVVAVLLGNGDGTFQAHKDYAVGDFPNSIAVGDFNLDGRLDLAVNNGNDNTISVLLGNGDGTFQPHRDYPGGNNGGGISVAAVDLNGDGKPDLVVSNDCCSGATVNVLLGNGDGTFQPRIPYSDPFGGFVRLSLAVGDFNGDGKPDLATDSVSVFLGNGDGGLQIPLLAWGTVLLANWAATGDFNGDGKLDIVTANEGGSVSVLLGNGDGTFQTNASYGTKTGPSSVTEADFNGDGKPDLAVAIGGSNVVSVFLGKGGGHLQKSVDYATGSNPASVTVADFNGDGKPDLVTANLADNTVSILLGKGDGSFQAHADFGTGGGPVSVVAGDFNGDGKADVAVANSKDNTVSVLLGKGDGGFQQHVDYAAEVSPSSLAAGDFNADGNLDLAVANSDSSSVSVLLGNGNGTFQAAANYGTGLGSAFVAAGDFDGNGKTDLAVAFVGNPDPNNFVPGGVSVLINKGDGTFQSHIDYPAGGVPLGVGVGDLNGDGMPDLVVANGGKICKVVPFEGVVCHQDDRVGVLLGNGNGSFQPAVTYVAGIQPDSLALSDLNHDGKPDLAVTNLGTNNVSVFLNNSTTLVHFTVSVALGGNGVGTVTSNPAGIDCGSTCSVTFVNGTIVSLAASPASGSTFSGWSGACSGAGACSVAMNADQSVTATFNVAPPPDFSLTSKSGSLTVHPGGQGTDIITIAPQNGSFGNAIQLACAIRGPAPLPTCALSATSVTPGANSATSTLTINAPAAAAMQLGSSRPQLSKSQYAAWISLMLGIIMVGGSKKQRRRYWMPCGLLLLLFFLQTACGGGSGGGGKKSPTTYTVTVTGTSGAIQHTTQATVTVQ